MKRFLLIVVQIFLIAALFISIAQSDPRKVLPGKQWEKKFGDNNYSYRKTSTTIQTTKDSSILIAGVYLPVSTERGTSPSPEGIWIWKINAKGEKVEDIKLKNFSEKIFYKVKALSVANDRSIYFVADLAGGLSELVRITPDGKIIFSKEIGTNKFISKIIFTSDGNSILIGSVKNNSLLLKADTNGNVLWEKIGNRGIDSRFVDGVIAEDGGFILVENAGKSTKFSMVSSEIWLTKFDSKGEKMVEKSFPGEHGTIVAGKKQSYALVYDASRTSQQNIWLKSFDKNLNEKWNVDITSAEFGLESFKIASLINGDYIVAGTIKLLPWISYISSTGLRKWDYYNEAMAPASGVDFISKNNNCYIVSSSASVNTKKKVLNKIRVINFKLSEKL